MAVSVGTTPPSVGGGRLWLLHQVETSTVTSYNHNSKNFLSSYPSTPQIWITAPAKASSGSNPLVSKSDPRRVN